MLDAEQGVILDAEKTPITSATPVLFKNFRAPANLLRMSGKSWKTGHTFKERRTKEPGMERGSLEQKSDVQQLGKARMERMK